MSQYELTDSQARACESAIGLALSRYEEAAACRPLTAFNGPAQGGTYYRDEANDWLVGHHVSIALR